VVLSDEPDIGRGYRSIDSMVAAAKANGFNLCWFKVPWNAGTLTTIRAGPRPAGARGDRPTSIRSHRYFGARTMPGLHVARVD